jgi:bleomycin hydrolase
MKFNTIGIVLFLTGIYVYAQKQDITGDEFTIDKQIPHTSIKNQYRSGTCWSFAALSFMESELIRKQNEHFDLSEMFVVKYALLNKARKFVQLHGHMKIASGSEINDAFKVIEEQGMVTEDAYDGKNINENKHIHGEMNEVVRNYLNAIVENKNGNLTPIWDEGFELVLNAYLGIVPETFEYKKKTYTPKTFGNMLDIDPDDYVYLTSFSHHPFYSEFILEVPDNWSWKSYFNVPVNELTTIIDQAIHHDYSVVWAGDISDPGYSWEKGVAELQDDTIVNQKTRQIAFNNYKTTDDHGMHIVGIAKNNEGEKYYLAKNSWGTDNAYEGYIYLSENYILSKTISLVVHKDALPKKIRKNFEMKQE